MGFGKMGQTVRKRLIVLSVMLAAIGVIANWNWAVSQKQFEPSNDLSEVLSEIPNWQLFNRVPLELSVVEALKLDDYVNFAYSNENGDVFLYIGQYFSNQQVGAAHDPMVCYPGQGWKISQRTKGNVSLTKAFKDKDHTVSYSSMITELNGRKNLVVYWFQANDSAHKDTLSQKLSSLWNVFTGSGHANALIRISTTVNDNDILTGKTRIFKFINEFYPIYLNYITSEPIIETE
jgi:EpsI family protein